VGTFKAAPDRSDKNSYINVNISFCSSYLRNMKIP
jgi:hypothetical protein